MKSNNKLMIRALAVFFVCICFFAVTVSPSSPPLSGSPITPEWRAYNKNAKAKGGPILNYFVTCKDIAQEKKRRLPKEITSSFSVKDHAVFFYARWNNVKASNVFIAKMYDPRGILFMQLGPTTQKGASRPRWVTWHGMFIRDAPASKLPGKWMLEIFMNGSLAARKEIIIGRPDIQHEKADLGKETPAIGVVRFIPKGGARKQFASWDLARGDKTAWLSWNAAIWIAQMFCVDYPNYRVIGPRLIAGQITLPYNMKIDDFAQSLLKTEAFADMIGSQNMKLVILGPLQGRSIHKGTRRPS